MAIPVDAKLAHNEIAKSHLVVSDIPPFRIESWYVIHEYELTSAAVPKGPRGGPDRHRDHRGPKTHDRFLSEHWDRRMAKRAKTSSNGNGANLGFEEKLWAAVDKLCGHMDAAEYKHVVLGLVFLGFTEKESS